MDGPDGRPEEATHGELVATSASAPRNNILLSALKPIPPHVSPPCRALAQALRDLFLGLGVPVRRYAVRTHHDPGTVSRYLNGTAVAPAEFVDRLLADAAEALGRPVSVEVTARVTALQRAALRATSTLGYELQLLKDELVDADRRARTAEANVEALRQVLLDKKHRIAEADAEKQRLAAALSGRQPSEELELEGLRVAHRRLREEHDRLQEETGRLREALEQAQRQAIAAEQRCEELERRMLPAEEALAVEAERHCGPPGRFTISHAGPERPWAVWIRHRLETIGHDAVVQSWEPPADRPLVEALQSLLVVDGTHVLLLSEEFLLAGAHTEDDWAEALALTGGGVAGQLHRLAAFALTGHTFPTIATTVPITPLRGLGADDDERRVLRRLALDPALAGVKTGASAPRYPAEPPPVWGDVPRRNPYFTGRGAQLAQLHHRLDDAPSGAAMCALVGMPAIGKTQIATEYAHRFAAQYDVVWWVAAGTRQRYRAGLAALAPALGVDAPDGRIDAVLRALRRGSPYGRWLLVLDGADEPSDIAHALPTGPGHVLITSQNSDWAAYQMETSRVLPLDRAESVTLIRRRVPRVAHGQADRLADELGDHPLALAQALAYLDHTTLAVPAYLDRLRDTSWDQAPLRATGDYPTTFSRALRSVLARLRESSFEAVDLLHVCVLFADSGAPLGLLRLSLPEPLRGQSVDSLRWQELVGTLVAHSLADLEPSEEGDEVHEAHGATLRTHPLVRRVVRADLAGGYRSTLLRRVHHALATADPGDPENVRLWPQYAQIVPHLEPVGVPGEASAEDSALILNCARYLTLRGEPRASLHLVERARRAWGGLPATDEGRSRELAARRGEALRALGHYDRALEADRGEAARPDADGAGSPDLNGELAADLRGLGRYEESLGPARAERASREELHGPEHPSALEALCAEADSLRLLGRYSEALALDRRAVTGYQNLSEPQDLGRLRAEARHALDLRLLGHFESALAQQLHTTLGHRELLGFQNPATLCAEHHLALCELRNDAVGEGLTRLREVCEAAAELLGTDAPLTWAVTTSRAAAERSHGNLAGATTLCQEAVDRCRALLGPEHPCTGGALTNLAVAVRLGGEPTHALALDEEARRVSLETLGAAHPWTLGIAYNLATDLSLAGRPEVALSLSRETAEHAERTLGPRHPQALMSRIAVAAELRSTGRRREAEQVRAHALAGLTETLGTHHRLTAAAHARSRPAWTFDPLPV
ncbi:FxSxx-COOH system tetratricopeptide repeat protein [Streptomyces sp. WG-D5]